MFGEPGIAISGEGDACVAPLVCASKVAVADGRQPKKVDDAPSKRKAPPTNSAPPLSSFRGTSPTAERKQRHHSSHIKKIDCKYASAEVCQICESMNMYSVNLGSCSNTMLGLGIIPSQLRSGAKVLQSPSDCIRIADRLTQRLLDGVRQLVSKLLCPSLS
jgi:hypothetical protein